MSTKPIHSPLTILRMIMMFIAAFAFCVVVIFLPAGTLSFWNGWLYMASLFIPSIIGLTYLFYKEPELLRRRMQYTERRTQQKWIVSLALPVLLLIFIIPGLDYRFGWSHLSPVIVILAELIMLTGYSLFFVVIHVNHYASRVIEVTEGQPVIQTGPYAVIRHPMYLATLMMYLATPVVLGSLWGILPGLIFVAVFVFRIRDEEIALRKDLQGYIKYCQKVRFRILPGIW